MYDNKLAAEEARRSSQHEAVKSEIEGDVNSEIVARAEERRTTPAEAEQIDQAAGEFRGKAVREAVETEHEVSRSRSLARVSQVVDFVFYAVYALLGLRLLLSLMAARSGAGFVQFIRGVTDPLYAPFRGIVGSPSLEGGYTLALPIVIAIVVYALLHAGINALLRLFAQRKTAI